MRASKFYIATRKEAPAEAELLSHQLLVRAGMVRLLGSGLYTIMPLGLRVLKKIEMIIRDELNDAGCIELLMPAIQPADLWKESGRWEEFGPQMLKIKDRHEREFCFGPTHEEVITDIIRKEINSYKQLPINLYQIQMKFRDEIRPRFGVMRAREFLMKDSYSFHTNFDCLKETYQKMFKAYESIFEKIGLEFRAVSADNGTIGGDASHEFHVLADSGEDVLVYDEHSDFAANIELAKDHPDIKKFKTCRGIEVGHIFQLGTKYSEKMSANFIAEDGTSKPVIMGCYGIGVSRIVAATIEQSHDEKGIVFPPSIAPFEVIITPIGYDKSTAVKNYADKLYDDLIKQGFDVLLDDRGLRPGVMFSEADLIGIPHRITVGEKTISENKYEYKNRSEQDSSITNLHELLTKLNS
ncbi:MAG: proline--tRNA ligase [Nitrosomonadales bacterium]|jgi:prolyl-tRNA synthetase|nr:proline--tRNA ligase [Nitrosomonadales bacterium]MBT6014755.1 proline--tRNA ligase [Nitrosomonadales bacterium]MBT6818472.1 proline--tRNA ligase [Nitrosomonadales bacterium]MBT7482931.1 proline--tRNA ligase [Nitrosomonadales bacterium]